MKVMKNKCYCLGTVGLCCNRAENQENNICCNSQYFAYNDKNTPGDEKHRIRFPFTKSPYAVSKVEAVKRLTKYIDSIEIIIVCPTFMLGAYDSRPSSGRIILFGYGKRMLFYPPGGKNFVHVSDVAHGIVKALQKEVMENVICWLMRTFLIRNFMKCLLNRPIGTPC